MNSINMIFVLSTFLAFWLQFEAFNLNRRETNSDLSSNWVKRFSERTNLHNKRDFSSDYVVQENSQNDSILKTRTRNIILCDLSPNSSIKSQQCNKLDSYNFTFSAHFKNKHENEKEKEYLSYLAQTLSDYTTCQVRYMKYDTKNKRLEYFDAADYFYWYDGKKLNDTFYSEVFILKDATNATNKKIVFKCQLPKSDVYLSMHPTSPQSSHSYPVPSNRVTVSAFHVLLNFMPIDNLDINLKTLSDTNGNEKSFNETSILNSNNEFYRLTTDLLNRNAESGRSIERYLIYYDGKCRSCSLNKTILNELSPFDDGTLICNLKSNTCEFDGKCYEDREISTPISYDNNSEKPVLNSFVCNSNYSQTTLYMPCAINNGDCRFDQICQFNASSFQVNCE